MAIKQTRTGETRTVTLPNGNIVTIRNIGLIEYRRTIAKAKDDQDIAIVLASCLEPKLSCVDVGKEIPEGTLDLEEFVGDTEGWVVLLSAVNDHLGITKAMERLRPLSVTPPTTTDGTATDPTT